VSPRCFFADLPGAGPCDGRLVRCHLVPRRVIAEAVQKRLHDARRAGEITREEYDARVSGEIVRANRDERSWVWGCGGPMGNAGHHGMLDASRTLRVPRHRLPVAVVEFAEELGLGWWVDREYGEVVASG
jgi:hypothetical protein